jgi:hypothetical protein
MPRLAKTVPTLRKHRSSREAMIVNGLRYYLGVHGSQTSNDRYDQLIGVLSGVRPLTFLRRDRKCPHGRGIDRPPLGLCKGVLRRHNAERICKHALCSASRPAVPGRITASRNYPSDDFAIMLTYCRILCGFYYKS